MKPLRILLVDDQRLFASSLKSVLEQQRDDVESVRIAANGEEAMSIVGAVRPDVVLMDTHMPKVDGIEGARRLHAEYPDVVILMLSAFGYEEYVRDAMSVGARGYLLKDITPEELVASIRNAVTGTVVLSPQVVPSMTGRGGSGGAVRASARGARDETRSDAARWLFELTPRERLLLFYIAKGYSNNEIADRVHIGGQTVRNYVSGIYAKMGAKDRFEAIRMAIEANISAFVPPQNRP
jgi:DNA-binding NarL/FixJ family response regulator